MILKIIRTRLEKLFAKVCRVNEKETGEKNPVQFFMNNEIKKRQKLYKILYNIQLARMWGTKCKKTKDKEIFI